MCLTGVCTEGQSPLLIMPFMSNGNVLEYVRHNNENLLLTSEATDSEVIAKYYIIRRGKFCGSVYVLLSQLIYILH